MVEVRKPNNLDRLYIFEIYIILLKLLKYILINCILWEWIDVDGKESESNLKEKLKNIYLSITNDSAKLTVWEDKLCWEVDCQFKSDIKMGGVTYYIDALTGNILLKNQTKQ